MAQITIGGVHFTSDGKTLTIASVDQPNATMSLDKAGVEELIDFVSSLAVNEFDRRQIFRVPLWDTSGLSVQIRKDETQVSVRPTNVSLTGIFIQLRSDDGPDLAQGDELEVTLDFEGDVQSYRSIVRGCRNNGYGLFFPESMTAERIDPPPGITRIVMELQRRWMARGRNTAPG